MYYVELMLNEEIFFLEVVGLFVMVNVLKNFVMWGGRYKGK